MDFQNNDGEKLAIISLELAKIITQNRSCEEIKCVLKIICRLEQDIRFLLENNDKKS